MPKTKQTTTHRVVAGKTITETEGKDYDADSAVAVADKQAAASKKLATMAKSQGGSDMPKQRDYPTPGSFMAAMRKYREQRSKLNTGVQAEAFK